MTSSPIASPIYVLADRFVAERAVLEPVEAYVNAGVALSSGALTDFSPIGESKQLELIRDTLTKLHGLRATNDDDAIATANLVDQLECRAELLEEGDIGTTVSALFGPHLGVLQLFTMMPTSSNEDWDAYISALDGVDASLSSYRVGLDHHRALGRVATRRQVEGVIEQCETWAGSDSGGYLSTLVASTPTSHSAVAGAAARRADRAFAQLGEYLRKDYLPTARPEDSCDRERYARWARATLGTTIDLDDAYAFGWEEVHRLAAEMERVADQIIPGGSVAEAGAMLDTDPARIVTGTEALLHYLQDLTDRTIADMRGKHFEIPDAIARCEVMLAPEGSSSAAYYTSPSEDLTRPGRTWFPTRGRTEFPMWSEVSTWYHEAVPGHHLQLATAAMNHESLDRFRRSSFVSGHGEGWALYAERLMNELGYFEDLGERLGYLQGQMLRAVRVVVDLGMHLGLRIPTHSPFHPGEIWNADSGRAFMSDMTAMSPDAVHSEIDRYLSMPAQAISYKVGERVWLDVRAQQQRALGPRFDLKEFHRAALALGNVGLVVLQEQFGVNA